MQNMGLKEYAAQLYIIPASIISNLAYIATGAIQGVLGLSLLVGYLPILVLSIIIKFLEFFSEPTQNTEERKKLITEAVKEELNKLVTEKDKKNINEILDAMASDNKSIIEIASDILEGRDQQNEVSSQNWMLEIPRKMIILIVEEIILIRYNLKKSRIMSIVANFLLTTFRPLSGNNPLEKTGYLFLRVITQPILIANLPLKLASYLYQKIYFQIQPIIVAPGIGYIMFLSNLYSLIKEYIDWPINVYEQIEVSDIKTDDQISITQKNNNQTTEDAWSFNHCAETKGNVKSAFSDISLNGKPLLKCYSLNSNNDNEVKSITALASVINNFGIFAKIDCIYGHKTGDLKISFDLCTKSKTDINDQRLLSYDHLKITLDSDQTIAINP